MSAVAASGIVRLPVWRARSAVLRVAERTAAPFDPSLITRIEPDAWRS